MFGRKKGDMCPPTLLISLIPRKKKSGYSFVAVRFKPVSRWQ